MQPLVHVIVVTHNSESVIGPCIDSIKRQGEAVSTITIVDSGSNDISYLNSLEQRVTRVIKSDNVGFARGNNLGFAATQANATDLILFLNPDAFLHSDAVAGLKKLFLEDPLLGCATGKLLGYDLHNQCATGRFDSTGVFRKWYGRWYDRGQGALDDGRYETCQKIPAICGALMCCSMRALQSFDGCIFDESFFMYKEDIELSLRIRENGWNLFYTPNVVAYHCRGWSAERKDVSYEMRLCSAKNEVKMYLNHPSVYIIWAVAKYLIVRFLRM